MAENLLTVAALRTVVEAEMIRGKLETAGIKAALFEPKHVKPENADPETAEPESSAARAPTARVQVQVSPPDFERAMQLLFPIPQAKPAVKDDQPPWNCPKCGERVLGQFPVCWSCGASRGGASLAASAPAIDIPPLAPVLGREMNKPALNGDSLSPAPLRPPRTIADETLKIVVPAWDAVSGKSSLRQPGAKKPPNTDADDRAARRAWWTALGGVVCPPLLIYSACVVLTLGLTNRPLSRRGSRFFYGALAVHALIMAAAFAWLGTHR